MDIFFGYEGVDIVEGGVFDSKVLIYLIEIKRWAYDYKIE